MISQVTSQPPARLATRVPPHSLESCRALARPATTAVTGTRKPSVNSSLRASSSAMKPMLNARPPSRWLPVSVTTANIASTPVATSRPPANPVESTSRHVRCSRWAPSLTIVSKASVSSSSTGESVSPSSAWVSSLAWPLRISSVSLRSSGIGTPAPESGGRASRRRPPVGAAHRTPCRRDRAGSRIMDRALLDFAIELVEEAGGLAARRFADAGARGRRGTGGRRRSDAVPRRRPAHPSTSSSRPCSAPASAPASPTTPSWARHRARTRARPDAGGCSTR